MKAILPALLVCFILECTQPGDDVAGTATDTNSGSIAGLLLSDGARFGDTLLVTLYPGGTALGKGMASPVETQICVDGEFGFDSLAAGRYAIRVVRDSLPVGQKNAIDLSPGEHKTVTITIVLIVNQTFTITNVTNIANDVTVNNYYFTGSAGTLAGMTDGRFVATFTQADTVNLIATLAAGGVLETVTITYVRLADGSYASLPLLTTLPIALVDGVTVVNAGTGNDSSDVSIEGTISEETR